MALDWGEHLSVGNAMIDADHKNLLVAVNSLEHVMGIRDYAALLSVLDLLETYMRIHFRNEEKIAEAINYPFTQNKLEHQHLLSEIQSLTEELRRMNGIWSDDLVGGCYSFLSDRVVEHIVNEDMQLKPVLEAFAYDFIPE